MVIDCIATRTTPVLWATRGRGKAGRGVQRKRVSLLVAIYISALQLVAAQQQHAAPPAPSAVPPNASRVTAAVSARKVWSPAELLNTRPLVAAGTTLWSLQLELLTATAEEPSLAHLLEAPRAVEAFSSSELSPDLVGKHISATLTLTGDTTGARWMIKNFTELP